MIKNNQKKKEMNSENTPSWKCLCAVHSNVVKLSDGSEIQEPDMYCIVDVYKDKVVFPTGYYVGIKKLPRVRTKSIRDSIESFLNHNNKLLKACRAYRIGCDGNKHEQCKPYPRINEYASWRRFLMKILKAKMDYKNLRAVTYNEIDIYNGKN